MDAVLWVTLNRPERLNALDAEMRQTVTEAMDLASREDAVRAVIFTGSGERAFCAGQDLTESAKLGGTGGGAWMDTWRRFFSGVSGCTKPIVAAINGTAAGAGLQLALMADIRLAVPSARLLMAEVNVGLPAIAGSCLLDIHLGQSRMRDLVLTGRAFSAEEAMEWGLIHALCAPADLGERAALLARTLAGKPPVAMRLTLAFLRGRLRQRLAVAEQAAVAYQAEAIATGEPQAAMQRFLAAKAESRHSQDKRRN